MFHSLHITERAEKDLDDAFYWYEAQKPGLGQAFIRSIDAKIANVTFNPHLYPIVQNQNIRRALIGKFPYSIYFEIDQYNVTIFAVLHHRRNPDNLLSRI